MIEWLKRLFKPKEEKLVWTVCPYLEGENLYSLCDRLNQLSEDGYFIFEVLGSQKAGSIVAFKEVGR